MKTEQQEVVLEISELQATFDELSKKPEVLNEVVREARLRFPVKEGVSRNNQNITPCIRSYL